MSGPVAFRYVDECCSCCCCFCCIPTWCAAVTPTCCSCCRKRRKQATLRARMQLSAEGVGGEADTLVPGHGDELKLKAKMRARFWEDDNEQLHRREGGWESDTRERERGGWERKEERSRGRGRGRGRGKGRGRGIKNAGFVCDDTYRVHNREKCRKQPESESESESDRARGMEGWRGGGGDRERELLRERERESRPCPFDLPARPGTRPIRFVAVPLLTDLRTLRVASKKRSAGGEIVSCDR
jgi:hypothetical protein